MIAKHGQKGARVKILLVVWQLGCAYGILIGYNGAVEPESSWFGDWATFWTWLILFSVVPLVLLFQRASNRGKFK